MRDDFDDGKSYLSLHGGRGVGGDVDVLA